MSFPYFMSDPLEPEQSPRLPRREALGLHHRSSSRSRGAHTHPNTRALPPAYRRVSSPSLNIPIGPSDYATARGRVGEYSDYFRWRSASRDPLAMKMYNASGYGGALDGLAHSLGPRRSRFATSRFRAPGLNE